MCRDINIGIDKKSKFILGFCGNHVEDYFICNWGGFIGINCERLSDKIYNVFISIYDGNYIKSELHF